jgi:hypothetical protein
LSRGCYVAARSSRVTCVPAVPRGETLAGGGDAVVDSAASEPARPGCGEDGGSGARSGWLCRGSRPEGSAAAKNRAVLIASASARALLKNSRSSRSWCLSSIFSARSQASCSSSSCEVACRGGPRRPGVTWTGERAPSREVHARGLRWEVVTAQPAGEQTVYRLRCREQGVLLARELASSTSSRRSRGSSRFRSRSSPSARHGSITVGYHQAFLLEQALGPNALLAGQPGRLKIGRTSPRP